jgi:hypothetical protein
LSNTFRYAARVCAIAAINRPGVIARVNRRDFLTAGSAAAALTTLPRLLGQWQPS